MGNGMVVINVNSIIVQYDRSEVLAHETIRHVAFNCHMPFQGMIKVSVFRFAQIGNASDDCARIGRASVVHMIKADISAHFFDRLLVARGMLNMLFVCRGVADDAQKLGWRKNNFGLVNAKKRTDTAQRMRTRKCGAVQIFVELLPIDFNAAAHCGNRA